MTDSWPSRSGAKSRMTDNRTSRFRREPRDDRQSVSIPMVGGVDSLNLAFAGSLMLYEIFRRRKPA